MVSPTPNGWAFQAFRASKWLGFVCLPLARYGAACNEDVRLQGFSDGATRSATHGQMSSGLQDTNEVHRGRRGLQPEISIAERVGSLDGTMRWAPVVAMVHEMGGWP